MKEINTNVHNETGFILRQKKQIYSKIKCKNP